MGYIGTKPSAVPLTSADITDGIITSAKIADGTIVNADINATSAITLNKLSGNPNFRNIVINGDMQIAQRGTSFTSQTTSNFIVDRFTQSINGTMGTWTNGQETDAPANSGFQKSLFMNCTTADAAPSAADFVRVEQRFEGQNLQYLKKGTASAVSLTASFWVKSPKTGTHIAELEDRDNTRYVSKSYTISTANTWEFKTVTFPPDTSGTLNNDNGESLRLNFWLGSGTDFTSGTLGTTWHTTAANRASGQVNVADAIHSTDNYWQITGVQLEAGTSATDFEFLPIDVSLGRCQRYYYMWVPAGSGYRSIGSFSYYSSSNIEGSVTFPISMRTAPTLDIISGANYYLLSKSGGNDAFNSLAIVNQPTVNTVTLTNTSEASGTQGQAYSGFTETSVTTSYIAFSAEL